MAVTNVYAEASDVQALLESVSGIGMTFSSSTKPSLSQVEGWLDDVAAEVDGILRAKGYATIPATGDTDKRMIGMHVAEKAAVATYHAGWGGFQDTPARVEQWDEDYKAFIARLRNGEQHLVDQEPRYMINTIMGGWYGGA